MTRSLLLSIAAIVCFILAALSAFTDGVNVNEGGFVAIGLACFAGGASTS